eukprot:COSAG06_NODE_21604_length_751_cov_1.095092_1_plen_92_part_01
MGMRMCPLSQTAVPQVFSPNYTLRQTIARYNQDEDFDEIAFFADVAKATKARLAMEQLSVGFMLKGHPLPVFNGAYRKVSEHKGWPVLKNGV